MSSMFFWLLLLHLESGVKKKKKNCSLLGALVFPPKTKTHIECVYYLLLQWFIIITQRVIISFYIALKYTNVSWNIHFLKNIWLGLSGWQCLSNIYNY